MSTFVILAIALTLAYFIYYIVIIFLDLSKQGKVKKTTEETIAVGENDNDNEKIVAQKVTATDEGIVTVPEPLTEEVDDPYKVPDGGGVISVGENNDEGLQPQNSDNEEHNNEQIEQVNEPANPTEGYGETFDDVYGDMEAPQNPLSSQGKKTPSDDAEQQGEGKEEEISDDENNEGEENPENIDIDETQDLTETDGAGEEDGSFDENKGEEVAVTLSDADEKEEEDEITQAEQQHSTVKQIIEEFNENLENVPLTYHGEMTAKELYDNLTGKVADSRIIKNAVQDEL